MATSVRTRVGVSILVFAVVAIVAFAQSGFETAEFQARRKAALEKVPDGIVLLRSSWGLKHWDESGFHQDPSFYYFSGLANAHGATLALDGRIDGGSGGAELGPTIIDDARPGSAAVTEELFGPVLTVLRAESIERAIELVNSSRYGNASAIFTSSGGAARTYRYGVEAGMVGVNVGVPASVAWFPFSGWKDSIDGDLHSNGTDAIDFYTRKKVVTSRWE